MLFQLQANYYKHLNTLLGFIQLSNTTGSSYLPKIPFFRTEILNKHLSASNLFPLPIIILQLQEPHCEFLDGLAIQQVSTICIMAPPQINYIGIRNSKKSIIHSRLNIETTMVQVCSICIVELESNPTQVYLELKYAFATQSIHASPQQPFQISCNMKIKRNSSNIT